MELIAIEPWTKSERLNIFALSCVPMDQNEARLVLIAFRNFDDQPTPVATMVIFDFQDLWVDWIEVSEEFRRQGYGTELVKAAEAKLGCLTLTGATDAGEAFVEKITGAK